MEWLWTWGGRSFGYRQQDNLWTHNGEHVGRFYEEEVYGTEGRYLGELRKGNRLITMMSKRNRRRAAFRPYMDRVGFVNRVDFVGFVMLVGYEDFPRLEQ